jgi:hypothetical protein
MEGKGPIIKKRSCMGKREDPPLFNGLDVPPSFFFDIESLFIVFLCSPSLHKSQDEISFKGGGL